MWHLSWNLHNKNYIKAEGAKVCPVEGTAHTKVLGRKKQDIHEELRRKYGWSLWGKGFIQSHRYDWILSLPTILSTGRPPQWPQLLSAMFLNAVREQACLPLIILQKFNQAFTKGYSTLVTAIGILIQLRTTVCVHGIVKVQSRMPYNTERTSGDSAAFCYADGRWL